MTSESDIVELLRAENADPRNWRRCAALQRIANMGSSAVPLLEMTASLSVHSSRFS
jgi:hypothetical protein